MTVYFKQVWSNVMRTYFVEIAVCLFTLWDEMVLIWILLLCLSWKVVAGLDLKQFVLFFKTWSELASGQIASTIQSYHSRKCLTGDFSPWEIFFWFLSLIALSGQLLLNDQERRRDASFFWNRCWIFSAIVPVSNSLPHSLTFSFSSWWGGVWMLAISNKRF